MMAVGFARGAAERPAIGRPRVLFGMDPHEAVLACIPVRCYDVAPDGEHFYAVPFQPGRLSVQVTHINLIQGWFEELKAKVPLR